jgi:serine/threonine protein kinase/tetratricopeptide (TPR) repeat protein
MDPKRKELAKELFETALALAEPDRSYFLAEACREDEELRNEVESLISGSTQTGEIVGLAVRRVPLATAGADNSPSAFSPGDVVSGRFRVRRFISHGGMGEVYEAEDLELGTRIALKTIRPEISSSPRTLARFKQEFQLACLVTHPNVCRLFHLERHHPSGELEKPDVWFLTMQLLEGETLAHRLRRLGRMTAEEALPLVRQMAEALGAAHEAGVVHRDFKPGNVMLVGDRQATTDSQQVTQIGGTTDTHSHASTAGVRAVITDFGLARSVLPAIDPDGGPQSLSGLGHAAGTPAYMAPEQLEGREVTPATDIYALGLVMYEIVAGQQPFAGQPYRRLAEPPVSPRVHAPTLDSCWEAVILRCLSIDPSSRFGTPRDLVQALVSGSAKSYLPTPRAQVFSRSVEWVKHKRLWVTAALGLLVVSVLLVRHRFFGRHPNLAGENLVVLPFTALGGLPGVEAYCDGFTVTVTTRLAQVPSLPVTPYFEVRDNHVSSVEDARAELGASLVLIPAWQRLGDTIRITLALVDTRTDRQLQARIVDGSAGNLFALQNRVVEAAVGLLDVERPAAQPEGTAESAAYDDYIRGRGYLQRFSDPKSIANAVQAFKSALQRDSKYGLAHAGLGEAYWRQFDLTHDASLVKDANEECVNAVNAGSAGAEAYICLGLVNNGTGQYEQGAEQFRRAGELEPTSDTAYVGLAQSYEGLNKLDDAAKTYRKAISLHPERPVAYNWLGVFYLNHGNYQGAVEMFSRVTGMAPGNPVVHSNLGGAYLAEGRYTDAIEELENAVKITPTYYAYSNLGTAYFGLRRFSDAARNYESALHIDSTDYAVWGNLGDAYTWAPGEHEKARGAYLEGITRAKVALQVNPRDHYVLSDLAAYHAMLGDRQAALDALGQALKLVPSDPETMASAGHVYNKLGDADRALLWLGRALAAGYSAATVRDSPYFDNLHSNPRFAALLHDRLSSPGTGN